MKTRKMKIDNMVKNVKSLSIEEMKKQSEQNYINKTARENSLIQAYTDKKLKSKALIKEAPALINAKEKANKPKDKATEQSLTCPDGLTVWQLTCNEQIGGSNPSQGS